MNPRELPWVIPVPVKKSRFTALHPEDARWNLQVDLSGIAPYAVAKSNLAVIFADLQTSPARNFTARLGAGRAAYAKGVYLKGVGRTPLAGNWNDLNDRIHATGHLAASAGAREYLLSRYLERLGLSKVAVSCTGLLLKRLDPELLGHEKVLYRGATRHLPRIDSHLQAISVRAGCFARASNFVWLFNRPTLKPSFGKSLALLWRFLDPEERTQEFDPGRLGKRLELAFWRGFDHFIGSFKAGISWGALHNNFTLDGRMLDLETPIALGHPWIGFAEVKHLKRPPEPFGVDAIEYVRQLRAFVRFLFFRMRYLSEDPEVLEPSDRVLAHVFHESLRKVFPRGHPLWSDGEMTRALVSRISAAMDLPRISVSPLREWISDVFSGGRHPAFHRSDYREIPVRLATTHSSLRYTLHSPKFLGLPSVSELSRGAEWNATLEELDSRTAVGEVFRVIRNFHG